MVQINENIILCEYCLNRDANVCIAKLDEIIEEIRKPSAQKSITNK
jgi:CCR4-NOT transcription complex subunit 10